MTQKKVKDKDTENTEEKIENIDSVETEKEEEIKKTELKESKENKEQEYLEGWKRCMADFENYKKRQIENQKYVGVFVREDLILQILPVIDNFHSAIEHIPEEQKDSPWVAGIMHIQKQLENILRDNGVEEIEIKNGDEFDPSLHEAVANNQETVNSEQETEKKERGNKISKIILKGYRIGEKVARVARVVVG
ncbi:TPA: nucleotide exchange factor GrpE [Candidatus Moranbacteria bacterium]|nr:nucleotide exchange factor GrpE [Candidatus Moranbacteria bacterium]